MSRKEYSDRWNAKIVNPGFTMAEYEKDKQVDLKCVECGTTMEPGSNALTTCYECYCENFRKGR